jgi:hypothetical protein
MIEQSIGDDLYLSTVESAGGFITTDAEAMVSWWWPLLPPAKFVAHRWDTGRRLLFLNDRLRDEIPHHAPERSNRGGCDGSTGSAYEVE